jgi:TonB family protein
VSRFLLLTLLASVLASNALADDLTQQLSSTYAGRSVLLRCLCDNGNLHFDSTGALKDRPTPGSWTTSNVLVKSVRVRTDSVEFKGTRAVLVFNRNTNRFDQRTHGHISIIIGRDPSAPDAIQKALTSVFFPQGESLENIVPEYWKWAATHLQNGTLEADTPATHQKDSGCPPQPSIDTPCHAGPDVTHPAINMSPDPEYTDIARSLKVSGEAEMKLVVDDNGRPQNIQIIKPIGAGLDEMAIAVLQRSQFKPATFHGNPVPYPIKVAFSWKLY